MAHVRISNLRKDYGSFRAIKDINLDIPEGEFVALLGPSGCGKTTTLRCIAGLEDISGGSIEVAGEVVSSVGFAKPPERRDMGMVFQSYAIWPHMTVVDNISFGLKLRRVPAVELRDRVERAMSMVGLSHLASRSASQLSGGQQQRVALARAVVLEPRILLFDEPLSNLDAKLREQMRFEIRQIVKKLNITSLYVTHDQQEAMVVADRVVLMNDGNIDQIGSPVDIYKRPASLFGAEFIGLINKVAGEVVENGTVRPGPLGSMTLKTNTSSLSSGQAVDVVFRPESVEVSDTPMEGANVLEAEVVASFFLGNVGDLYLRVGEVDIRTQLSPPRTLDAGRRIWIRIAPESIMLFKRAAQSSAATAQAEAA